MNTMVLPYMELKNSLRTSFHFAGENHNVHIALPEVFDKFISQVVKDITYSGRSTWPTLHRWRIINLCLASGALVLIEVPEEKSFLLQFPMEEKTSENEILEERTLL